MPKCIIEVVHAGISSLKIHVKGRKGWKETLIVYEHTQRLRTAKGSKVVQGDLPHIPIANGGQISCTLSLERIIGLTMCKVLFLKILTVAWFILCSCEEDTRLSLHICIRNGGDCE